MQTDYPKAHFHGAEGIIIPDRYYNGAIALQLIDTSDGVPFSTATVNLPDKKLGEGEVAIKDWSENEGIFDVLLQAGLIEDTGRRIPTGYVTAKVARLTYDPFAKG